MLRKGMNVNSRGREKGVICFLGKMSRGPCGNEFIP